MVLVSHGKMIQLVNPEISFMNFFVFLLTEKNMRNSPDDLDM